MPCHAMPCPAIPYLSIPYFLMPNNTNPYYSLSNQSLASNTDSRPKLMKSYHKRVKLRNLI